MGEGVSSTGLSRLPVNTAQHLTGTEHSFQGRQRGHFEDRGYSLEGICSGSDQDSDFRDEKMRQAGTREA